MKMPPAFPFFMFERKAFIDGKHEDVSGIFI